MEVFMNDKKKKKKYNTKIPLYKFLVIF